MNNEGWCATGEPAGPDDASPLVRNEAVLAAIERVKRAEQEQQLDAVDFASKLLWSYVGDLERRWQEMEQNAQQGPDKQAMKEACLLYTSPSPRD